MAHGYNTEQELVLQLHELSIELTFFIGDKVISFRDRLGGEFGLGEKKSINHGSKKEKN
jgi:hypothetical protein